MRAGNDNALVSAINTMWAITGATTAISTSGSNLVTNWTSAQANYWNTLNAEVFTTGGQTIRAALSQEASTRATQTGQLYGQYTVKIDTNGYVAGFGLASAITSGLAAIFFRSSGLSTPAAERPRKISAPSITSARLRLSVSCA